MMNRTQNLSIAFIWHMHQPYYKDETRGLYMMPWVRLHGIKDYYPMAALLERFGNVKAVFNIVPSLAEQIDDYVHGDSRDILLDLTLKRPGDCTLSERCRILEFFFKINYKRFIEPNPRYVDLLIKKGIDASPATLRRAAHEFSEQDFVDLQVLFNLGWFHSISFDQDVNLRELRQKQEGYTEEDKQYIISCQKEILSRIVPLYKKLQEAGRLELSCSPRYHPILPLLCDTDIAKGPSPHLRLPERRFSHPEDAEKQIEDAIEYHHKTFGRRPSGMWPSEGSVSDKVLDLLTAARMEWVATDEDILFMTLATCSKRSRGKQIVDRSLLYQPYRYKKGLGSLAVVFRDKNLSNLISFSYNSWDPQMAALDLMNHFRNINASLEDQAHPGLVTIVMDGENAWEYYEDNGRRFFETLYACLDSDEELQTTTVSDYLKREKPKRSIDQIYPGSWINHNFEVWIGNRPKNLAWEYIARAREELVRYSHGPHPLFDRTRSIRLERAWRELYIAEGSDWNWWHSFDSGTSGDISFDSLFRMHLRNLYHLLNVPLPDYLKKSIA